jgi:hypothetical protein
MNEGLESPSAAPPRAERGRGRKWFIVVTLVIGALGVGVWMAAPDYDPRLVGEWQSKNGVVRVFHPDGRAAVVEAASGKPLSLGGPLFWTTEGHELIVGHRKSVTGRAKKWWNNLFSSQTGVLMVSFGDSRYEIVE